jgi:predicted permease
VPDSSRTAVVTSLLTNVRAVPGVEAASVVMRSPLGFGGQSSMGVEVEGYVPQRDENTSIEYQVAGSDYFAAQGVPILQGRGITDADVRGGQLVAVINEQFAKRFWPGQDAVGKRFRQGGEWRAVVGVARQGVYHQLTDAPQALSYLPYAQLPSRSFDVMVRSGRDPKLLTSALRHAFQATNRDIPFLDVRTMAEHMQAAMFVQQLGATMLAAFGGIALLLSAIGIYGVMAYNVSQRTREIGVRVALGAARGHVVRLVVSRAMKLVAIGMAAGLAAAFGAGRLLRSQLLGVSPHDPLTFTMIALLLGVVALAASWLPARRASRVDPMVALRSE